jgi:CSLREA domain-containing protein
VTREHLSRTRRIVHGVLLLALSMALAMQTQAVVQAATLTVNSLADPGNGTCDATECTLREAIAAAAPGDTIDLSDPGTIRDSWGGGRHHGSDHQQRPRGQCVWGRHSQ